MATHSQPAIQQPRVLTPQERRAILERTIAGYLRYGYRVISQTDTTAQLVKPKEFSCLWATLWLLVFGVGVLVYLFYYAAKRDDAVYISVDEYGRVHRQ